MAVVPPVDVILKAAVVAAVVAVNIDHSVKVLDHTITTTQTPLLTELLQLHA